VGIDRAPERQGVSDLQSTRASLNRYKVRSLLAPLLVSAPLVGYAQPLLDALTEGIADAARVVGEVTKGAVAVAGQAIGQARNALIGAIDSPQEGLIDEVTPEETRAKRDGMAETALARLFAEKLGGGDLFDRSAGYA
jgi:hypothetical protein